MMNNIQELRDAYNLIKAVRRNNMQKYDVKFLDQAMEKISNVGSNLKEKDEYNNKEENRYGSQARPD